VDVNIKKTVLAFKMQIDKTREPYSINPNALASWVQSTTDQGARTNGKLSQNKLAQKLDCDSGTISRWKAGKAGSLYQETIEAIAQFENMSFDEVLKILTQESVANKSSSTRKSNNTELDTKSINARIARLEEENQFFREEISDLREIIDTITLELNGSTNLSKTHRVKL
jgi:transcriptional regulator with XRE-family HTH domain